MRKPLRTALGVALGTALVSATMTGAATPAFAADCAGAAPLRADAEVGTLDPLTLQRWWSHSVDTERHVVSLATPAGSATLEVRDATCATTLCTDRSSAVATATCTVDHSGPVVIGIVRDAAAGPTLLNQVMAYVVDVLDIGITECNDGLDNDRDGAADWPADDGCRNAADHTESPVHVAALGHITIETDAAEAPQWSTTGFFGDPSRFTCGFDTVAVEVTCVQVRDPEFLYVCTHFVLTAKAFSTAKPLGPGTTSGAVSCDSGNTLVTEDADSARSLVRPVAEADSFHPYVALGTAYVVRCRALGANGAAPTGAYTVDCAEPGAAWPVETVPDPLA
ncbi:MAG TPA: hypothetical protein VGX28_05555 [Frankiaceae bacterium]|jgi:hypothetical protein|nr:hypothetical protein [Frankiaceae bacterium]